MADKDIKKRKTDPKPSIKPAAEKPQLDRGTWNLVNRTAIGITFAFAIIAGFLTWQLHHLLNGLNAIADAPGFGQIISQKLLQHADVSPETAMSVALEHDF